MSIALVTTSCEDETEPTHFATQDQASASSAATRALVYAMPAYFNHIDESLIDEKNWHGAFGYGAMMIIRDLQTGDRSIGTKYNGHFKIMHAISTWASVISTQTTLGVITMALS